MDQAGNTTSSSTISVDLLDYTVTFKDYDGDTISSKTYNYGQPVSIPNNQSRLADETYTYQFKEWETTIEASVTKDATYTAVYTPTYINYKVEFLNYDGTILQTKNDYHWDDPVTSPSIPSKTEDDTFTYEFAGWDKEVTNVAGNTTYTAQYTPIYKEYNIVFKDWNGDILSEKDDYHWGDSVELPETPTKDTTVSTIYTFSHYTPTVTTVQGDMEYTAVYSETVNSHTVTFKNYDGSIISSETYDYGEEIVIPSDPSKPADETYIYEFTGWSPRVDEICNGGAEYIAQLSARWE